MNLKDLWKYEENIAFLFHEVVVSYEQLNNALNDIDKLKKQVKILEKEKSDYVKQVTNIRLNFKEVKRNIIAKVRQEEKEKYEKDSSELMLFFKGETQHILKEFSKQRHQLMQRTTNVDNMARYLIQQEIFLVTNYGTIKRNEKSNKMAFIDEGKRLGLIGHESEVNPKISKPGRQPRMSLERMTTVASPDDGPESIHGHVSSLVQFLASDYPHE